MLTVGVDSYISLVDANTYFNTRVDVAAWTASSDPEKEKALATAAALMNEIIWVGVAASDSQVLAFPRAGDYMDPVLGKVVTLNTAQIPQRIKAANCEQAYQLLNNDGLLDETGRVSKIKVDTIELSGLDSNESLPPRFSLTAQNLFYPLTMEGAAALNIKYSGTGTNAWFRAN